jgi:hypothetical protein
MEKPIRNVVSPERRRTGGGKEAVSEPGVCGTAALGGAHFRARRTAEGGGATIMKQLLNG